MKFVELFLPTANVSALEAKVAKLNKRADKLNLPRLAVECGDEVLVDHTYDDGYKVKIPHVNVVVTGEIPRIEGWGIIAGIDHIEGLNIVRAFEEVPAVYRERKPFCDHCNTHKVRVKSTLIKNTETGEFMQVGNTCLKDFVKRDVAAELAFTTAVRDLIDDLDGDDWRDVGRSEPVIDLVDAYGAAFGIIDAYGFAPASDENPTKFTMNAYFFNSDKYADAMRREIDIDNFKADAEKVIEWIENEESNSDFFFNLRNINKLGYVLPKFFGYVAGAVAAYHKAMAKKAERAERLNEYVDVPVKKRVTMKLTLNYINAYEGYYGTTYIHTFNDADGRAVVWYANNTRLEASLVGTEVEVKATVKEFKEYKGTKQTIVNRVAVV